MEEKSVFLNESPEFLCPSCGTSAFEVTAKQKNIGQDGKEEEFLVMKCLVCLDVFYHHFALSESAEYLPQTTNA